MKVQSNINMNLGKKNLSEQFLAMCSYFNKKQLCDWHSPTKYGYTKLFQFKPKQHNNMYKHSK